jgi:hypothetical protein
MIAANEKIPATRIKGLAGFCRLADGLGVLSFKSQMRLNWG